jgi:hypothetical protein
MRRTVWLTLAIAINAILATVSQAQTNSCISSTDGFWDEARIWSLEKPPSIRQSAILITNDASETVTIDSTTATHFKSTLTISNLDISPQSGSTDVLYLDNTGTIALHILDGLTIGVQPPIYPPGGVAVLISSNSTLIVDGLLGGQLEDDGTMVFTGGSLITTNCTLQVATTFFYGLLIISNSVVQARDVGIASGVDTIGTIELIGGTMTLSSSLIVGNGDVNSQGSMLVANASLVVTNGGIGIGGGGSYGIMTLTNATVLASGMGLGGNRGGGNLYIESSSVKLAGGLTLDEGEVSFNGGILVVTNGLTALGEYTGGGAITVEDGSFLAREIIIGTEFQSSGELTINGGTTQLSSYLQIGSGSPYNEDGGDVSVNGGQLIITNGEIIVQTESSVIVTGGLLAANHIDLNSGYIGTGSLSINGGSVTASTGITLGDCANNAFGYVTVDGGQLTVTNASGTGFIDVQDGQLVLSNGVLQVDKLVMTNSCSQFIHTGGTLIVGSVVLDPNAFQIVSVTPQGKDILISWLMGPGQTNALQATAGGAHGSYTTNGFADIFVVTNNTTTGSLTNYLDIGAATNVPSRFYRARLAP